MNEGHVLEGVEYAVHGVLDRQDEAGRELSQRPSRVHQSRRVGEEIQVDHHLVEERGGRADLRVRRAVHIVSRGNGARHATKELFRSFDDLAVLVPGQVALFQHYDGVFRQPRLFF